MGRTAKNPGKPKGRMSAYAFFLQDSREEIKRKDPNKAIELGPFSKLVSEKWKSITEKEKKKYIEKAEKDSVRYKEEMADYTPSEEDNTKKRKRGKATKDPNAPKRALSAFFCFCNEERPRVKGDFAHYTLAEVAKELGKRWDKCKDRTKFEALAAKDKERYEKEKALYENGRTNGEVAKKSAPAKSTRKAKLPAKKPKRGKETEDEDDDEEEEPEEQDDEDESD